jgi:hypothetical protein
MPAGFIAEIDAWAGSHEIGRSEAVRRLCETGLNASAKGEKKPKPKP